MAAERWTDERMDQLAEKIDDVVGRVDTMVKRLDELATKSETWDDRFFQLSRDTLNFSRNIIVTAAVIAVITPALRDALSLVLESFLKK